MMASTTPSSQLSTATSTSQEVNRNVKISPEGEKETKTAKKEPKKDSAVAQANPEIITKLGPNDVLLGRGTGPSCYEGNKAFRIVVDERKLEYVSNPQYRTKGRIGQEVLDKIQSRGGRFLRQLEAPDDNNKKEGQTEDDEKWVEVDDKTALEKCKQALREHRPGDNKKKEKKKRKNGSTGLGVEDPIMWTPHQYPLSVPPTYTRELDPSAPHYVPMVRPPLQLSNGGPSLPLGNAGLSPVDCRLLLYQSMSLPPGQSWIQQQQQQFSIYMQQHPPQAKLTPYSQGLAGVSQSQFHNTRSWYPTDGVSRGNVQRLSYGQSFVGNGGSEAVMPPSHFGVVDRSQSEVFAGQYSNGPSVDGNSSSDASSGSEREKDAVLALSALSLAGRPRFTEEQEALEKELLTDEERAAILADIFGKLNKGIRQKNKKARRDLDKESINFLLMHMRHEIERIPDNEKPALLEARRKAKDEEFSDARLELFLRCEDMNATLAAQRFVYYWEARRSVFGEGKFTLPLTLSEALRDDFAAIEAGVYCLLPHKDLSGRQLIYLEPHRHTGEGYTSESLLRAFWYTIEVASQNNTDVGSGFAHVVWDKFSSLRDFDRYVWDGYIRHMSSAWPMKSVAVHSCCTPPFVVKIIKPILFALTSKTVRSRVIFHGPESEVLASLSEYGILGSMLPTYMGGSVNMNQSEWIAQRRALEMEEI